MVTDGLSVSRLAVVDRQTSIRFVRARPYSGISVEARPTGRQTQSPRDQFDSARSQRSSVLVACMCVPRRVALRSIVYQSYLPPVLLSRFANCLVSWNEREREEGRRRRPVRETGESRIAEERNGETTALNTVFALHAPRQKYLLCAWFRVDPRRASDTSLATTFLSSSDRRRETCRRWAYA